MIKDELLNDYEEKVEKLVIDLHDLSEELIYYIPDIENAWSIEMHQKHLLEVELNQFYTLNDFLKNGMHKKRIDLIIENIIDFKDLLNIYKSLRKDILGIITKKDFNQTKCKIKSSVHGILELELDEGIRALNNHLDVHKEFIDRNINEYSIRRIH